MVPGRGTFIGAVTGNTTLVADYADPSTGGVQSTERGSNFVADVQVDSVARHGTAYLRVQDGGSAGRSAGHDGP